ncbi:MAG: hydroxyethylthiazole kinase [Kiloniellales bacterium]|nr:hydroxyethylthiazole kinase [Kiloniellales bacterium]
MSQSHPIDAPEEETPWHTLNELRERSPAVHNLTSTPAGDLSADLLLAVGAVPTMFQSFDEVEDLVGAADALTVNIGAPTPTSIDAMVAGVRRAIDLGTPWVLDPAGASVFANRYQVARRLAHLQPTVIRGNGTEILALGNGLAAMGGPRDEIDSAEALDAAHDLAKATGAVIAITGTIDYVTDGKRVMAVANGHPLMSRVAALGCALTCLVGACCAVGDDPLVATAHAIALLGLSGELAAAQSAGPGSFRVHLIDQLYALDQGSLAEGARVQ